MMMLKSVAHMVWQITQIGGASWICLKGFRWLWCNKKLSCRRETARCFALLNISLSHSRSCEMIPSS